MTPEDFTPAMTGTLIPVVGGPPDVQIAFVPAPLPPSWVWPERLWRLLVEARAAVARLDGIGKHLPNPDILLTPLQRREAQLSSQLEGTITDPQQQALFQADPQYPTSERDPNNPLREVFNYQRALKVTLDKNGELPLSLRLIRKLHGILMDGVRGSDQRPGEFRRTQNQIGRPARFVPPPPHLLDQTLNAFENYLHSSDEFDPLVRSFLAHYQFEAIHPFGDGSGRVGRLLLSLTIAEWCKLSSQWLYMSAFFERRKRDYMDLMLGVSTHGAWDLWIEFCLEGVVSQAVDTEKRCEKLLGLHRDFQARLKGGSVRLSGLVNSLFESPVLSVKMVKQKFGVTYPTARADLKKLHALEIIQPLDIEFIAYYCPAIYDVTYEGVTRAR